MKKIWKCTIVLFLVLGLSACHFIGNQGSKEDNEVEKPKATEETKESKEQPKEKKKTLQFGSKDKKKDDKGEQAKSDMTEVKKEQLNDKQARKKMYDDYAEYYNRLAEEVPEYEAIGMGDGEEPIEISEWELYEKLIGRTVFGVC